MKEQRKLYRLHELSDYKVASDYPDVRGWKIMDADNRTIGEVDELLVNKVTERVVYLDVTVNDDLLNSTLEPYETPVGQGTHEVMNKDGENHLIVPIGAVSLDQDHKHIISNDINYDTFSRTKRLGQNQDIEREYEVNVINVYYPAEKNGNTMGSYESDGKNDQFYDRPYFNKRN